MREYGSTGISLSTIHSISSILFTGRLQCVGQRQEAFSFEISLSNNQHEPRAANYPHSQSYIYEDEQEMLNVNGGLAMVPHPQPGVLDI